MFWPRTMLFQRYLNCVDGKIKRFVACDRRNFINKTYTHSQQKSCGSLLLWTGPTIPVHTSMVGFLGSAFALKSKLIYCAHGVLARVSKNALEFQVVTFGFETDWFHKTWLQRMLLKPQIALCQVIIKNSHFFVSRLVAIFYSFLWNSVTKKKRTSRMALAKILYWWRWMHLSYNALLFQSLMREISEALLSEIDVTKRDCLQLPDCEPLLDAIPCKARTATIPCDDALWRTATIPCDDALWRTATIPCDALRRYLATIRCDALCRMIRRIP